MGGELVDSGRERVLAGGGLEAVVDDSVGGVFSDCLARLALELVEPVERVAGRAVGPGGVGVGSGLECRDGNVERGESHDERYDDLDDLVHFILANR